MNQINKFIQTQIKNDTKINVDGDKEIYTKDLCIRQGKFQTIFFKAHTNKYGGK